MEQPSNTSGTKPSRDYNNTRLAADRTYWAADRTFIAWLRTSLSMLGFGFAIGKGAEVLEDQGVTISQGHVVRFLGAALIALAILGLAGALFQDFRVKRRLSRQGYPRFEPLPLSQTIGVLVICLAMVGILSIVKLPA